MQTPRRSEAARILAVTLLVGSALGLIPQATATNSDWHLELVSGLTDIASEMSVSHNGETLGLAFKYLGTGTNGKVGFAIRTAGCTGNACWTVKSQDISGAATTTFRNAILTGAGGSKWVIGTDDSTTAVAKFWQSTDDGATWTATFTAGGQGASCAAGKNHDVFSPATSVVGGLYCDSGGKFILSTDGGATWSAANPITDNNGAPGSGGTASRTMDSAALAYHNNNWEMMWRDNAGQSIYDVGSGDGLSWTVPYGTPCETNLGGSVCQAWGGAGTYGSGSLEIAGAGTALRAWAHGSHWYSFASTAAPIPTSTSTNPNTEQQVDACSITPNMGQNHAAIAGNSADVFLAVYACGGSPAGLTVRVKSGGGTWADTYTDSTITPTRDFAATMTATKSYVLYQNPSIADRTELLWSNSPTPTAASGVGVKWCSDIGADDFNFDFVEDVDTDGELSIGGATGHDTYIFHAGGGFGLALLGVNLADGLGSSHALNTTFKIEAASESQSSDFRVTYGFTSPFARGNGDTTGSFTNALQVRFTESGSVWHMETRSVTAGVVASFGATANRDDPNNSHRYQFLVDTRSSSPRMQLRDETGGIILNATLPSVFVGLAIQSQWYTSDHGNVLIQAQTGLSPTEGIQGGSTCIWDLEGSLTGLPTPGPIPCTGTDCSSTTSSSTTTGGLGGLGGSPGFPGVDIDSLATASGMSSSAFGGFAAILFMLIIATTMGSFGAMMSKNSNVPIVMGGIGAVGGLGLDMFFGLIPLWLAALLGVAAIGLFIFLKGR